VLRTVGPTGSLFELLLPAGMRVLTGELAEIDRLLDDERFFVPFAKHFHRLDGRPSIPIETYLRMMFLKVQAKVGYERVCTMIGDSISLRRFCRIGLEVAVPDESTIRKITTRCGPELVEELNRILLRRAHRDGQIDLGRVRLDSTVVEADVKYPTDSGLLTVGIGRLASRLDRLVKTGVAVTFVDRGADARALQHSVGMLLRRRSDEAVAEVLAITGRLADLADLSLAEAANIDVEQVNSRAQRRRHAEVVVLCERLVQVAAQARLRLAGGKPDGSTRLVSLFEPDARPIRKGRLGKPVEFGYKAQAVDNIDGLILDHSIHVGNPGDVDLIRPAIARLRDLFNQAPVLLTADRGYWDSTIETDLKAIGIDTVVIPRTGKPSQARQTIEHADEFVAAVKWRTGCEGRISALKRECGWRRTRLRTHIGARVWCAHGVFVHNLTKLVRLQT
jgi:transposase, IS5 family